MIVSSQRPLPVNTQHSQTDIHAPSGTQTHNLSRRAAADLRLRPHDDWDRPKLHAVFPNHLFASCFPTNMMYEFIKRFKHSKYFVFFIILLFLVSLIPSKTCTLKSPSFFPPVLSYFFFLICQCYFSCFFLFFFQIFASHVIKNQ